MQLLFLVVIGQIFGEAGDIIKSCKQGKWAGSMSGLLHLMSMVSLHSSEEYGLKHIYIGKLKIHTLMLSTSCKQGQRAGSTSRLLHLMSMVSLRSSAEYG